LTAQRLVSGARFVEPAAEIERERLFLLERAQRRVERLHQLLEGLLEVVELADLAAGVAEEIAQGFVFLAHARADVGESLDADGGAAVAITGGAERGESVADGVALAAEQIRQLCHDKAPRPLRQRENATPVHR
jgi:hypothetical protein